MYVFQPHLATRRVPFDVRRRSAFAWPRCPSQVFHDEGKIPWEEGDVGSALPGALIAASVQDRDFEPLSTGDPLFERLDGSVVEYDGSLGDVVYPVFVNEAAYYYAQSGRGVGVTKVVDWPLH